MLHRENGNNNNNIPSSTLPCFFFFFVLKKTSEDTYIALVDHTVYIKIMWNEHTPVVRV